MAKIKGNIVTKGWSGKFGDDIVFKRKGNRTYVALSPTKGNRERSEKQKAHLIRFKLAILYGKAQIADPAKKARYEAKATEYLSAFNQAVADYMKAPVVDYVDIGGYTGQIGDKISVTAFDNFEVTEVEVQIADNADNIIEQGVAVLDVTGTEWEYTTTVLNGSLSGSKVKAIAKDYPGNETELEVLVP